MLRTMLKIKERTYEFLRGSENFFKADMVYLAKNSFWQTFGQAVSGAFSFVLILVFAKYLPKETYGVYKYILSLAAVLNIFTLTGVRRAVVQAVADGYDGALKVAVKYQLKWNIVLFLSFLALGAYYTINNNLEIAISLIVIGLFSPFTNAFNTYGAYLEGRREFKLNNIFSASSTVVYVLGMLIAVALSGQVVWLVFAYATTTLATTLYFYYQTLRIVSPQNTDSGQTLSYGKKLTLIGVIAPVATQIDSIILTHFWGATQLAIYSIAMAIPVRANSFIKSLVDLGLPKFVVKSSSEIDSFFFRRILQGLVIGSLAATLYIILAPYLFRYLIPEYLDSTIYSQLLALSLVFAMPNRYISLLLESRKLSWLIFMNNLIVNIMRITLYVVFGILGGIMGLALAYVLTAFLGMLINITTWRSRDFVYEKFRSKIINFK